MFYKNKSNRNFSIKNSKYFYKNRIYQKNKKGNFLKKLIIENFMKIKFNKFLYKNKI